MSGYNWKGWRCHPPEDFYPIFRERPWMKILYGKDLILVPFPGFFRNSVILKQFEDEEWEFIGFVITKFNEDDTYDFTSVGIFWRRR